MNENRTVVPGDFYRHFKNKIYQIKGIAYHSETKEKLVVYQAMYGDFQWYVRPFDMFISEVDHWKYPDVTQKYRFERIDRAELTQTGSEQPEMDPAKTIVQNRPEQAENVERTQYSADEAQHSADRTHHSAANTVHSVVKPQQDAFVSSQSDRTDRQRMEEDRIEAESVQQMSMGNQQDLTQAKTTVEPDDEEGEADPRLLMFLDAENFQEKLNVLTALRDKMDDKLIDDIATCMDLTIEEGPVDQRYLSLKNCIVTHAKYECNRLR